MGDWLPLAASQLATSRGLQAAYTEDQPRNVWHGFCTAIVAEESLTDRIAMIRTNERNWRRVRILASVWAALVLLSATERSATAWGNTHTVSDSHAVHDQRQNSRQRPPRGRRAQRTQRNAAPVVEAELANPSRARVAMARRIEKKFRRHAERSAHQQKHAHAPQQRRFRGGIGAALSYAVRAIGGGWLGGYLALNYAPLVLGIPALAAVNPAVGAGILVTTLPWLLRNAGFRKKHDGIFKSKHSIEKGHRAWGTLKAIVQGGTVLGVTGYALGLAALPFYGPAAVALGIAAGTSFGGLTGWISGWRSVRRERRYQEQMARQQEVLNRPERERALSTKEKRQNWLRSIARKLDKEIDTFLDNPNGVSLEVRRGSLANRIDELEEALRHPLTRQAWRAEDVAYAYEVLHGYRERPSGQRVPKKTSALALRDMPWANEFSSKGAEPAPTAKSYTEDELNSLVNQLQDLSPEEINAHFQKMVKEDPTLAKGAEVLDAHMQAAQRSSEKAGAPTEEPAGEN